MLKAQYTTRGPAPQDVIDAVPFDAPPVADGQVRIELLAAPINPSDVLTLTGHYGILPPLPAVGGSEGVGRVTEHGPNVTSPAIGQTVLLPLGSGTWATHFVADAQGLIALPDGADPVQLSMLSINPPTASLLLSDFVELDEGDWVIQNAANSGVGSYLISLAKERGLKTVNIVRREALFEPLLAAGADVVLVDGEDLAERVRAATDDASVMLGIDAVGGAASARLGAALSDGATLVVYGGMSGEPAHVPAGDLIFRDLTVRGFWLALWFQTVAPQRQQEVFGSVAALVASGQASAPVQATYRVADIKEAVAAAAGSERSGKVIVVGDSLDASASASAA